MESTVYFASSSPNAVLARVLSLLGDSRGVSAELLRGCRAPHGLAAQYEVGISVKEREGGKISSSLCLTLRGHKSTAISWIWRCLWGRLGHIWGYESG